MDRRRVNARGARVMPFFFFFTPNWTSLNIFCRPRDLVLSQTKSNTFLQTTASVSAEYVYVVLKIAKLGREGRLWNGYCLHIRNACAPQWICFPHKF